MRMSLRITVAIMLPLITGLCFATFAPAADGNQGMGSYGSSPYNDSYYSRYSNPYGSQQGYAYDPYRTQQEQQAKRRVELQKSYDRALEWLSRHQGNPGAQERAYRKYWGR
jgi:hypothetical protein